VSFETLGDLNWLAVVVAAVAYYALGAIWYARPAFGSIWMDSIGWKPDPESGPQMSTANIVLPIAAFLVTSVALGMLAASSGTDTLGEGVLLGFVAGVGVAAMITLVTAAYDPISPKPVTWFLVTGGYHLVGIVIASGIIGVWQ
jgi:hypothetical protein